MKPGQLTRSTLGAHPVECTDIVLKSVLIPQNLTCYMCWIIKVKSNFLDL